MNQMPGRCPVCDNALLVTGLQCDQCGTGINGVFSLGRLQALSREQLQFVEIFIKARGKIKDVENELDISYPTVIARLNEVVRAMGYVVDESQLSEVDRYEFYEAQVINPKSGGQRPPVPFVPPIPPIPPVPPVPPLPHIPHGPKLSQEKRGQILEDLESGKITAAEAMRKLHG